LTLLARWHQAARKFVATSGESIWFRCSSAAPSPGIIERLDHAREWSAEKLRAVCECLARGDWPEFDALGKRIVELYRSAAPAVIRDLELGRQVAVPLQPCLRDVWHDHVLYTGDDVSGLIDAHACRSDNVANDLSRLLGSLVGDDRAGWESGIAAYERLRPLSLAERGLIELFDRSTVLFAGLTWLEWHCVAGRIFDRPEQVIERLRSIVGRLERVARAAG
jgi:Ser/Thr protein kinase RdoA (MazF antagonist)